MRTLPHEVGLYRNHRQANGIFQTREKGFSAQGVKS
jgi:hypothetical protein